MKIKITLFLALSLIGFFAVNLLFFNNSKAFTETKTGSVDVSYGTGSGNQTDLSSLWLGSQSTNQESLGYFQENFLAKVIEQLGTNNYPVTYKFLIAALAAKSKLNEPDAWGPVLLADECTLERKGILNCLSGTGEIGRFNGQIWKLDANIDPVLYFLANRPDLIESQAKGMNISYPSHGELKTIPNEINKLKTALASSNPAILGILNWSGVWGPDFLTFTTKIGGLSCSHSNKYYYDFEYNVNQDNVWKLLSDTTVHKCEEIKLKFIPNGEWFASMCGREGKSYTFTFASPPTDIITCSDQADCLSKGKEYSLTSDTYGKGVQKVPADFVAQTEESLSSSDNYMTCADGICSSKTSGNFLLAATAPAASYFGQCRGYGTIVDTPETVIPAVTSSTTVNIKNRAPVASVSLEKATLSSNEETKVTCDIVDPDECSDKIAKVKWTCNDSNGDSSNCYLWKEGSGVFNTGESTQALSASEKANPYQATAYFKASKTGTYSIKCEAWDDDANNPLSGTGVGGVIIAENCGSDGVCNSSCLDDPDCGVIAAHSGFCAIIPGDDGNKKVCGENGSINYNAYSSGIDVAKYIWKCSTDGGTQESAEPNVNCYYNKQGVYMPQLTIVDKKGKETTCTSETSGKITTESKCQVKIKKVASDDDYKAGGVSSPGTEMTATVDKQCLEGGKTTWEIENGSIKEKDNNTATFTFSNIGNGKVKAIINTADGKSYNCGEANAKVKLNGDDEGKEKIQWGM